MSEELLGVIRVIKTGFPAVHQDLFLTPDKVIVAKTGGGRNYLLGELAVGILAGQKDKELRKLSIEGILSADKSNYAISLSEISKVEIKKKLGVVSIQIETKDKKNKWSSMGIVEKDEGTGKEVLKMQLFHLDKLLRPVFGDKLLTES